MTNVHRIFWMIAVFNSFALRSASMHIPAKRPSTAASTIISKPLFRVLSARYGIPGGSTVDVTATLQIAPNEEPLRFQGTPDEINKLVGRNPHPSRQKTLTVLYALASGKKITKNIREGEVASLP